MMNMTLDEIRAAVLAKEICGITIDTSVFDEKQRGLEYGLLRRFRQFKDSDISFILSEIVERELEAHMFKEAAESATALKKALSAMATPWALAKSTREQVSKLSTGEFSAEGITKTRLAEYFAATGSISLKADDHVSVSDLVVRYFGNKAPFADKETKKYEFPDALAVLSLESWAAQRQTKVVVVTKDADWRRYCEESQRLVAVDDLAAALGCFQEQQASYYCRELAESIRSSDSHGFVAAINEAVKQREDSVELSVEVDSQFHCEENSWEADFQSITIDDPGSFPMLEPVDFSEGALVVRLNVQVEAEITVDFSFSKWDSIDREYMSMGGGSSTSSETLEVEVLVSVSWKGEFPKDLSIDDVEVGDIHASVSFGDLGQR